MLNSQTTNRGTVTMIANTRYTGIIERYQDRLPVSKGDRLISLGEGNTPLIKLDRIAAELGKGVDIYVKYEGLNPTGSFKDRGMVMAVTGAINKGAEVIICASTGNTSAAAAAYAARANIRSVVLIPEGKIAMGKLAQALMYDAKIIQIKGNFDDGMQLVKAVAANTPIAVVNSINPHRLQGQKTIAFEIIEALGRAPTHHCLPVGNAGNISAHWMGYTEFFEDEISDSLPKMLGYQAAGAAPFLRGAPVESPETLATAIRIGNPQSWDYAVGAQQDSGGWFDELTDAEILAAQQLLASKEGVFCEPASAASFGGALRDINNGKIPEGSCIVCTLTGNGLKDPDIAMELCNPESAITTVEAKLSDVEKAILA